MLTRKTGPLVAAVSDAEAMAHLKVDSAQFSEPDVAGKVWAAVQDVENITGRQLIDAVWQLVLPTFPDGFIICLPKAPLKATGVSVTYLDDAGATQTLNATKYTVTAPKGDQCLRGWLQLNATEVWPSTYSYSDQAVTVEFTAGYGTAPSDVPGFLRSMILVRLGELHEMRQAAITGTIYTKTINLEAALSGWRLW